MDRMRSELSSCHVHEGVIDREHENLTGFLELGVVDVSRHMGARASRAYLNRTIG